MRLQNIQQGIGHVMALLAIVIVAVTGFAGYTVMTRNAQTASDTTQQRAADSSEISSQADLAETEASLDKADTEIDAEMNGGELDADVDSLL